MTTNEEEAQTVRQLLTEIEDLWTFVNSFHDEEKETDHWENATQRLRARQIFLEEKLEELEILALQDQVEDKLTPVTQALDNMQEEYPMDEDE